MRIREKGRIERVEKKKAAAAAVATVITASGAAVDANFDDPAEMLQNANVEPQVQDINGNAVMYDEAVNDETDRKKSGENSFREWILHLPLAVRAIVVVPVWAAGAFVMNVGEFLFTALSPFAHWILSFVLMALVIAGAFLLTAKAIFPDLPIRKILNRHSIKWILVATVVAFAADLLLGVFWTEYTRYKTIVIAALILLALGSLITWFSRREKRRREKEEMSEPLTKKGEELVFTSLGETFTVRSSAGKSDQHQ